MPQVNTKYFGALAFDDSELLFFERGLPGFEAETQFLAVRQAALEPLMFLQSVRSPDLCFPALPVGAIAADFRLECDAEELLAIGIGNPTGPETLCLAIVTLTEGGPPTANLLAPVAVNVKTGRAAQIISADGRYSHRHPIPEGGAACW